MPSQSVEAEAGSLEEARQKILQQIPEGFAVQYEQILSDGKPITLQATAETTQSAREKALNLIPPGGTIQSERTLISPELTVLIVQAFDEQEAKNLVYRQIGETSIIKRIQLSVPPRKGWLGIGKSPGSYEVEVVRQAVVEITYICPTRMQATIDHAILIEADRLLGVKDLKGLEHLKGEIQLEAFLLKIATGPIEQFKLIPEAILSGLIESAHLGSSEKSEVSQYLTQQLLDVNCRDSRVWNLLFNRSYGSSYGVERTLNHHPIEALNLLLWYLYTAEAATNHHIRSKAQLWFLGLAESHYEASDPALQEKIVAALNDMILNWQGQYFYVIPRCCKVLVATGRKEVLSVALTGIQLSDVEYTQTLRSYAKDDSVGYLHDPQEELQEWEQFKLQVQEALKSS